MKIGSGDTNTDYFPKQTAEEYAQEEHDYANMHWKLLNVVTAPIKNYFSPIKERYLAAKVGARTDYQIIKLGPKPLDHERTRQALGIITQALEDLKDLKSDFALEIRTKLLKQQEDFRSTVKTQQFETAQYLKKEISKLQKTQLAVGPEFREKISARIKELNEAIKKLYEQPNYHEQVVEASSPAQKTDPELIKQLIKQTESEAKRMRVKTTYVPPKSS